MKIAAGFVCLMLISSAASASELDRPFGIERGQQLAALGSTTAEGENFYALRTVPKPHPLMKRYSVKATRGAGVCAVSGYVPVVDQAKGDWVIAELQRHATEIMGQPTFLPGNRSPDVTGIWLWMPRESNSPLKTVTLTRFDAPGSRRAAVFEVAFTNAVDCDRKQTSNGFK